MKYIAAFFLFLVGYSFIYAGLSHFFPQYTMSQGG